MNSRIKIIIGSLAGFFFFCVSKAYADVSIPMAGIATPDYTGNILVGILSQAINNPASFSVIGLLMVISWLCDDLPFIPSKYVKHLTVMTGMSIYWTFANPETVSRIYPHPFAIYISNGAVCGAFAYIGHWQITTRLKLFFANRKIQTQNP